MNWENWSDESRSLYERLLSKKFDTLKERFGAVALSPEQVCTTFGMPLGLRETRTTTIKNLRTRVYSRIVPNHWRRIERDPTV